MILGGKINSLVTESPRQVNGTDARVGQVQAALLIVGLEHADGGGGVE